VSRVILYAAALLALAGVARADETLKVKPSATVEVLDDKAKIDDVISRLQEEPPKEGPKSELRANRLPPPPPVEKDLRRNLPKSATSHRPHHEHERNAHKH